MGIWPRGGGKSTTAEAACVAVGARDVRGYALYISETQDQADKHVESVGAMLESPEFGRATRSWPIAPSTSTAPARAGGATA